MNVTAASLPLALAKAAAGLPAKGQAVVAATSELSAIVSLSSGQAAEPPTYGSTTAVSGLLDKATLLLPTRANAAMLAAKAGAAIAAKLDAAGIPRNPAFDLAIDDVNSAHVTVKGNRADAKAIEDLINGDQSLQMDVHNAYALASHIPAMDRSMAFQQEYRAAQTQAQIDAVIARYSDLFSGFSPAADITVHFGKDALQLTVNGETIHT